MGNLYVNVQETAIYPPSDYSYNPGEFYPEYLWGGNEVSPVKNDVYEMVRTSFVKLGLDYSNYGSEKWNLLGDIIKKNQTVNKT